MIILFCDTNKNVNFMKINNKINKNKIKIIFLVLILTILNFASIYTQKTEAIAP